MIRVDGLKPHPRWPGGHLERKDLRMDTRNEIEREYMTEEEARIMALFEQARTVVRRHRDGADCLPVIEMAEAVFTFGHYEDAAMIIGAVIEHLKREQARREVTS